MDLGRDAQSLFRYLEQLPDPCQARGIRYPFQPIVRLTILGLIGGQTTMADIACYGKMHGPTLKDPLGFVGEEETHSTTIY